MNNPGNPRAPAFVPGQGPLLNPPAPANGSPQAPANGPVLGPAVPPQNPADRIPADRRAAIDSYVNDNARHESGHLFWHDNEGGSRVGAAMRGSSSLGAVNGDEQAYLAQQAARNWMGQTDTGKSSENVRDALNEVKDDPNARRILTQALAAPELATMKIHAEGGYTMSSPEGAQNSRQMLVEALKADPRSVLANVQGGEAEIAKQMPAMGRDAQRAVWSALADPGAVRPDVQERLTSALLVTENGDFAGTDEGKASIAKAVALARRPGGTEQDCLGRSLIESTLTTALADPDTRNMLFNQEVRPDLRMWAMGQLSRSDVCVSPDAFKDGWESPAVSKAYAQQVTEAYRGRGTEPQALSGEALRNTIGQALGVPPDQLPADLSSDFLAQGLNAKVYSDGGDNAGIDRINAKLTEFGGTNPQVTVIPITVTSKDQGAATVPLFRVETEGGPKFVDHNGDTYNSVEHWEETNRLPEGKMTYAQGLDLKNTELTSRNTPGVVDSAGEVFGKAMDYVALGAGIVAGGAAIFFSGGAATPFVVAGGAAIGGGWGAYRAGSELNSLSSHGRDLGDLSDPEVRSAWVNLGASTLSIFAAGGAARIATSGSAVSPSMARMVAGIQLGAEGADALAMTDATVQTAQNWDKMSGSQKAGALFNIAFWGGMTLASGRAGGASATDSVSFSALTRRLETGTSFDVNANPRMAPGEVGVRYDTTPDGRTTNVRVEYGGTTPPDRATLARHDIAAQQIARGGSLNDRILGLFGGKTPPVGSQAWEARIEINKMQSEAGSISRSLARTDLTPQERTALQLRQGEIGTALDNQTIRLTNWSQNGTGIVGDATTGASQATSKGWPKAPEGYTWVADKDGGDPHLRRKSADQARLDYDPATRTFTERADAPAAGMTRVGHGTSEVTWQRDTNGNLSVAEGTLREYYSGADRSSAETTAQREAAEKGLPGDQGGHAVGHRFVLDQGLKNLFPQNANFNMGAYRNFESEMAAWIGRGYDVKIKVEPQQYDAGGRPAKVRTRYEVVDPNSGKLIHMREKTFTNGPDQTYKRLTQAEIQGYIDANG